MKPLASLVRLVWRAARWQTVVVLAMSTALSLTEGISLAALFPIVSLLADPARAAPAGPHTQRLFGLLTAAGLARTLWLPVLLLALLVAVGLLAQLNNLLSVLESRVMLRVQEQVATRTFDAILHADWTFLAARRSAALTQILTSEVVRVGQLASTLLAAVANLLVALLLLGIAAVLAPWLTLLLAVCFALLLPLERRSRQRLEQGGQTLSERNRDVYDSATERLANLKAVKAYEAQTAELALFERRYRSVSAALERNLVTRNRAARRFQLISFALLCAVLVLGLSGLHLAPAAVLVFLAALLRMVPRLNQLQSNAANLAVDLPALTSVENFLAECALHIETNEAAEDVAPALHTALTLDKVDFRYPGGPLVLEQLSLTLPTGRMTAVAGGSGAGKSTLADLVLSLLFPTAGAIRCDGTALTRQNARASRRRVGYVSQDTLLFHDTLRANLLWARPQATEAQLERALGQARAGFVFDLPLGLETVAGDRGILLSHGQRQRLALARAFLLEPELLILDEATNSLDVENEAAILAAVVAIPRLTVLLISHRPSALRHAETIHLLEGGRVAAAGNWHELGARIENLPHAEDRL